MPKPRPSVLPIALSIAGSDSGGGAGVQADLKTFAALEVHGCSVVTTITAQSPERIARVYTCPPAVILAQLEVVFSDLPPGAAKIGLLSATRVVRLLADFLAGQRRLPLVLDPIITASSGHSLLSPAALRLLCRRVLPLCSLITPNLPEAEVLSGTSIKGPDDLSRAATVLFEALGCPVLIKGGHLANRYRAVDLFFDGSSMIELESPRVRRVSVHGTGCAFSAAITAFLAKGLALERAVRLAKGYISSAIRSRRRIGGHWTLDHFR